MPRVSSLPSRRCVLRWAAGGASVWLAAAVLGEGKLCAEIGAELLPQDEGRNGPPVVTALAVEPQRGLLAMGGDDHRIRISQLKSRVQLHLLTGHTDWVRSLAFSRSGNVLFSAGNDGKLLAWTEASTKPIQLVRHTLPFTAVVANPAADVIAATTWDGQVHLFDAVTLKSIKQWEGPGNDTLAVAFSPDGHLLAAASRGRVMLWNATTAELIADEHPHRQRIRSLAFSPDGKYLASAGDDRRVHLQPLASEQAATSLPLAECKIFALQFLPGDELAVAGSDGNVRVWNVPRQEEVRGWRAHLGTVAALAWHDGQLLTSGFDASVRMWSLQDRVAVKLPAAKKQKSY